MENSVDLSKIDDSYVRSAVADYLNDLREDGLTIRGPGKFEGEPLWTVYFYQLMLNGDGEDHYANCEHTTETHDWAVGDACDDCDCELELEYTRFDVQAGDAEIFPSLEASIGKELRIREDSQGFVYGWIVE